MSPAMILLVGLTFLGYLVSLSLIGVRMTVKWPSRRWFAIIAGIVLCWMILALIGWWYQESIIPME